MASLDFVQPRIRRETAAPTSLKSRTIQTITLTFGTITNKSPISPLMTKDGRHVVFVSQHFPPDKGGNAARIYDMAINLVDEEWAVTVLSPPPSYPPGEFERSWQRKRTDTVNDVTVRRLWTWQPQREDPGMVRRLLYYLLFGVHAILWLLWNVRRYDVVVTTTPPISTGAPGLLAAVLGKPWVVDVRDLWIDASISLGYLEAGSLIERVSRRFQRLVLHTADRIAVTTETLSESLQETYGESLDAKMIVIPNGVDIERFQPERDRKMRGGKATDDSFDSNEPVTGERGDQVAVDGATKPDDVPTIIYTGNLGSAQDLESCIRGMSHLSHDTAVLRLVGGGDMESELHRLISELDLHDRVTFDGVVPREEIPLLLSEAMVGIAPLQNTEELDYAMPTKVYEYLASELPVLVTGRGEIERFVDESGGGVHVENDPERIAEKLDDLLADDQLRRQLAETGRNHVEGEYDRKAIAQRLSDDLTRLVADNDARILSLFH